LNTPSEEERSQLTERVLSSNGFARSPRLRSFLRFICENALHDQPQLITEHAIGVAVFGRDSTYNPSEDSIVRSQARLLRQRLEEYFRTEGVHEAFRISIPKGGYYPVFEVNPSSQRTVLPAGLPLPEQASETPPVAKSRTTRSWMAMVIALALVITATGLALMLRQGQPAGDSPDSRFWSSLCTPKRITLIVPADSSLVLMEELTQTPVPLKDYLSRQYLVTMSQQPGLRSQQGLGLANSQYTSIADLNFVAKLMRNVAQVRANSLIRYARDMSMIDAQESNLMLIGGARANPWVELCAGSMNLYVDFDWKTMRNVVINKHPAPGEPAIYAEAADGHQAYGVLALIPSLDHQGNTLIVAGTSTTGTEAAADFLLDSAKMNAFLMRIGKPNQAIPHFEMLFEAENIAGKAPRSTLVAYRILP